jgi:hypothetical protein
MVARKRYQQRLDDQYIEAHRQDYNGQLGYDSLYEMLQRHSKPLRADANATAFLARDLLFVRQQTEQTIYDRLRAAEFVPIDTSVPRGARTVATRLMDRTGAAKVTHDLAGDSPRADVSVTEDEAKFVNIRASYGYSIGDLEHAAFSGIPLTRDKSNAAADAIARGLDEIGRVGNAAAGLTGFFNDANVATVTLTNGEWLTATAAEILADLAQIETAMITQSRGNWHGRRRCRPAPGHLLSDGSQRAALADLDSVRGASAAAPRFGVDCRSARALFWRRCPAAAEHALHRESRLGGREGESDARRNSDIGARQQREASAVAAYADDG